MTREEQEPEVGALLVVAPLAAAGSSVVLAGIALFALDPARLLFAALEIGSSSIITG